MTHCIKIEPSTIRVVRARVQVRHLGRWPLLGLPLPLPLPHLRPQPLLRSVACVGTSVGQALEGSRPSHCSLGPVSEWQEVFNFCFITKNDS